MSCFNSFAWLMPRQRRPTPSSDEQLLRPAPSRVVASPSPQGRHQLPNITSQNSLPGQLSATLAAMAGDCHQHKRAKHEDTKSKKETCRICYQEIEGPYLRPCLDCRQAYCHACVKKQFEMALKDKDSMPVHCCRKVIHHDVANGILSPAQLGTYKVRYDESVTANPFYCPEPTCSAFIPPRKLKPIGGKITCTACKTVSCFKCRHVADHFNHECPSTTEVDEIIAQYGYKRCPKCNTAVMKMYGCPHVRCANCGAHFCWDCLRPINVCTANPCVRAREDGDVSEDDDGDCLSEDESTESILAVGPCTEPTYLSNQASASVPNFRDSAVRNDSGMASTVSLIAPGAHGARVTVARSTSQRADSFSNMEPRSPAHADAAEATVGTVSAPTPDPASDVVNLDDPDRDDVNWEHADEFDFGEEPSSEDWDIWGCLHRFSVLKLDKIPDHWMPGLDKSRPIKVECMGCFDIMSIDSLPREIAVDKSKETRTASTTVASESQQSTISTSGNNTTAAMSVKPPTKDERKRAVYTCRVCGVIFCWECRRTALRRTDQYRQQADE